MPTEFAAVWSDLGNASHHCDVRKVRSSFGTRSATVCYAKYVTSHRRTFNPSVGCARLPANLLLMTAYQ
jgi:hypothetical protein